MHSHNLTMSTVPTPPETGAHSILPKFCSPVRLARGLLITMGVDTFIALALWHAGKGAFDDQMAYSQGIGLSTWALVNAGAIWMARPEDPGGFPRGWRAWVLVPVAVLGGVFLGTLLGDAYSGKSTADLALLDPGLMSRLFVMSVSIGLAMTMYFYLAGKSSYLQAELERTQRQNAEAQLKLLESQLEPHMLFNTLANLRVLIGLDPARAQTMLDHMIAYLRATLSATRNGAHTHTLATEFDRLNDYLALMAIRMGPRLQVSLDLPTHLRDLPIPPLLLQPLVENAILHGLEPKVEGGHITVSAQTEAMGSGSTRLCLCVSDTGVGPDDPANPGTGFGLMQVRERLSTTYGPTATLDLIANKPSGSSARVLIDIKQ